MSLRNKKSGMRTHVHISTADGDSFSAWVDDSPTDDVKEQINSAFALLTELRRDRTLPKTESGSKAYFSRYAMTSHYYAASHVSFTEALEIHEPPEGRARFVLYHHDGNAMPGDWFGDVFWEFATLANAMAATEIEFRARSEHKKTLRTVKCGWLRPWFFALGNDVLIGDYVVPDGMQEHPYYRLGERYAVRSGMRDINEVVEIKVCLGSLMRPLEVTRDYSGRGRDPKERIELYVFWHDGSHYREIVSENVTNRPVIIESELVDTTLAKTAKVLAGESLEETVEFSDGGKLVVKYIPPKAQRRGIAAGDYNLSATFSDGKSSSGWLNGFSPTEETPTIVELVSQRAAERGKEVERVEIVDFRSTVKGGKKWRGVLFAPRRPVETTDSPE